MRLNNREVCHRWANCTDQNNTGSNLFNEGRRLYSYGHHFLLAELFPHSSRGDIALVNEQNYSSTTAKHKRYALDALASTWRYIEVPRPGPETAADHAVNIAHLIANQNNALIKLSRARIRAQWYIDTIDQNAADYAAYVKRFPESKKAGKLPKIKAADMAEYKKLANIYRDREEKARAIREQVRAEKDAANLAAWRRGENNQTFYYMPIALRLSADGLQVQTSRGASVDVDAARKLYHAWASGANIHGLTIGSYTITSASREHVTIGCHEISAAEIDVFFKTLDYNK